nr:16069_t:CDS:2 [Entrophospora candida]
MASSKPDFKVRAITYREIEVKSKEVISRVSERQSHCSYIEPNRLAILRLVQNWLFHCDGEN